MILLDSNRPANCGSALDFACTGVGIVQQHSRQKKDKNKEGQQQLLACWGFLWATIGLSFRALVMLFGLGGPLQAPLHPLILGGDHSISFPVVGAVSEYLRGQVDILHFDAHLDIYHTFEGNYCSHATPFAQLMESGYARPLLQSLGEGVKGVYVSIDVNCLDPAIAPGVSHIEPGGLTFRDVMNILQPLQGNIVGGDVVEFNPQRDTVDGMTAMVAAKVVRELTAKMSRSHSFESGSKHHRVWNISVQFRRFLPSGHRVKHLLNSFNRPSYFPT